MESCEDGQQMAPFETYYIYYSPAFSTQVFTLLSSIQKAYASFRYFQPSQDLTKAINQQYNEIKLTKRKKTFAVLAPISADENPEALPEGCKTISISESESKEDIQVSESTNWSEVETQLVGRLQLDSVWVGLLCRIGTNVEELQSHLINFQHFNSFEVSLKDEFMQLLEVQLNAGRNMDLSVLRDCREELQKKIQESNYRVEELVRSRFNCRVVIKDITMHPFLHLLKSRSYFNLIFIEEQVQTRFKHFKSSITGKFPRIIEELQDLGKFIRLDEFVYSEFIFGCLKKVTKYINRTLEEEPYSQLVRKHHKDIIREFRPSMHEYFLSICLVLKERAACLKEAVGSIIVKDRNIISTGYNGTPMGTINCYNGGCQVCNNSSKMGIEVLSCRCIHAQYNCILTAGITSTPGAILYSSKLPCLWCAKLIIQGQISEVIFLKSKYGSLDHDNMDLVKKTFTAGKVILREMELQFNESTEY